jgi:hypothetical protein
VHRAASRDWERSADLATGKLGRTRADFLRATAILGKHFANENVAAASSVLARTSGRRCACSPDSQLRDAEQLQIQAHYDRPHQFVPAYFLDVALFGAETACMRMAVDSYCSARNLRKHPTFREPALNLKHASVLR